MACFQKHIAIYGGSFNPPHFGHEIACSWLIRALEVDKVIVAPTHTHYFGKELADFRYRIDMCEKMIRGCDGYNDGRIKVSDAEAHLPKPNTTLNLIKYLKIWYPNQPIAVVIGSDLLGELDKWDDWDGVDEMADIIVVGRHNYEESVQKEPQTKYEVHQYPIELSAVSSSDIRKRIKEGEPIWGLVPANTVRFMHMRGIYRGDPKPYGVP